MYTSHAGVAAVLPLVIRMCCVNQDMMPPWVCQPWCAQGYSRKHLQHHALQRRACIYRVYRQHHALQHHACMHRVFRDLGKHVPDSPSLSFSVAPAPPLSLLNYLTSTRTRHFVFLCRRSVLSCPPFSSKVVFLSTSVGVCLLFPRLSSYLIPVGIFRSRRVRHKPRHRAPCNAAG